jgi:hypothetical protein
LESVRQSHVLKAPKPAETFNTLSPFLNLRGTILTTLLQLGMNTLEMGDAFSLKTSDSAYLERKTFQIFRGAGSI